MDLTRTRVVLRERPVVDVLDLGLRFLVEHGGVYARTAGMVLPPFFLLSVVIARAAGPVAAWTFALFMATFAAAPFTVLASRLVFEDEVRAAHAIAEALRAAPRVLALRLVSFTLGGLAFTALVVPGVWIWTLLLFVVEVTVLERATVRDALSRSARIAGRESGEALVALVLLALLHFVAVVAADSGGRAVITALLESRAPADVWSDGWSNLSLLGFWLFVPYAATARFFVYLDVRTRTEGWDIQTRFVALARRPVVETRSAA